MTDRIELTTANEFIARHIGPRAADEQPCCKRWVSIPLMR